MTNHELSGAYISRCHKRLKEWSAPLKDWYCTDIYDMAEETQTIRDAFTCELCDCANVRFVHVMRHDQYFEEMRVGCICAGVMEDDIIAAQERERSIKNRAKRRVNFSGRKWHSILPRGFCLVYRGTQVLIFPSHTGDGRFSVHVRGKSYWTYKGKPITNFLSATYAAFEIVDPRIRA